MTVSAHGRKEHSVVSRGRVPLTVVPPVAKAIIIESSHTGICISSGLRRAAECLVCLGQITRAIP